MSIIRGARWLAPGFVLFGLLLAAAPSGRALEGRVARQGSTRGGRQAVRRDLGLLSTSPH